MAKRRGGGGARCAVESVFLAHAVAATLLGGLAFALPHVFEYVFFPHGERFALRNNARVGDRVEHLLCRVLGALLLGSAWAAWSARANADAAARRALVQAFGGAAALVLVALLRAQLAPDGPFSRWNFLNIAALAALTAGYGRFVFLEPIKAFEGLGHVL